MKAFTFILTAIGAVVVATSLLFMVAATITWIREMRRLRHLTRGQTVYVVNLADPKRIKATFVEWRDGKALVHIPGIGETPVEPEKLSV